MDQPALLDLGNGQPPIDCRVGHQALLLARLWVAHETGRPAGEEPPPPPARALTAPSGRSLGECEISISRSVQLQSALTYGPDMDLTGY